MREPQFNRQAGRTRETESSLLSVLGEMRLSELREIVRQRGWAVKAGRKAECVAAIAPLITDPTEVARAVTALPDRLRTALRAAFVAEDGNGMTPAFLARVMTALSGNRKQMLRPVEAAALLHDLARWGLIIPWRGFPNGPRYLFPSDVQGLVPPLPGWCHSSPPAAEVPALCRNREQLARHMAAVWERIAQLRPELRPPQAPPGRSLRTAASNWAYDPSGIDDWLTQQSAPASRTMQALPVPPPSFLLHDEQVQALSPMTDGDTEELEFICHLLCELGLARKDGGHLVAQIQAMEAFGKISALQRHQRIAQAYLSLVDWSELDMLVRADSALVLQRNPRSALPYRQLRSQLLLLRHTLLRFLVAASEDTWCSFADLDAALRMLWPDFFPVPQAQDEHWLSQASRPAWRLTWQREKREMTAENEDWEAAQGTFLRLMAQGPLYWLGLASLSELDGQLLAVRLHGLGDLLWNRSVPFTYEGQRTDSVLIDAANWTITVQPSLAPPEIHPFLASIARLEQVSARGYVYRLDMRTAHTAFGRESFPALMAEWQSIVPLPIPGSMHEALQDWWARYGQVHLYEGLALLEVTDDLTLQELEASTSLQQHILARLSPRLLVLRDRAVDALIGELAAKGYMPREVG